MAWLLRVPGAGGFHHPTRAGQHQVKGRGQDWLRVGARRAAGLVRPTFPTGPPTSRRHSLFAVLARAKKQPGTPPPSRDAAVCGFAAAQCARSQTACLAVPTPELRTAEASPQFYCSQHRLPTIVPVRHHSMTPHTAPAIDSQFVPKTIAAELALPLRQVHSAIELLNAGNTIPFIARYRKEATQGLDEVALRAIEDALDRTTALAARKSTVLKSISRQGLLTDELRSTIENCPRSANARNDLSAIQTEAAHTRHYRSRTRPPAAGRPTASTGNTRAIETSDARGIRRSSERCS